MTRAALILNGLVLSFIALRMLLTPAEFLAEFGVALTSATALAEARSIHGGGIAAIAALIWLGLFNAKWTATGLLAAAVFLLALTVGRAIGIVVDGATDSLTITATVAEFLLGSLAAIALFFHQRSAAAADRGKVEVDP